MNYEERYILNKIRSVRDGMSESQIQKATGLSSARLRPVLVKMEQAGAIISEWEPGADPRSRIYLFPG